MAPCPVLELALMAERVPRAVCVVLKALTGDGALGPAACLRHLLPALLHRVARISGHEGSGMALDGDVTDKAPQAGPGGSTRAAELDRAFQRRAQQEIPIATVRGAEELLKS